MNNYTKYYYILGATATPLIALLAFSSRFNFLLSFMLTSLTIINLVTLGYLLGKREIK